MAARTIRCSILRQLAHEDNRVKVVSLSRNFGHQPARERRSGIRPGGRGDRDGCRPSAPPGPDPADDRRLAQGHQRRLHHPRGRERANGMVQAMDLRRVLQAPQRGLRRPDHPRSRRFPPSWTAPSWIAWWPCPSDPGSCGAWSVGSVSGNRGSLIGPNPRHSGKSKYSLGKMFGLALQGLTSFSSMPLRVSGYLGLFGALAGLPYAIWAVYAKLFTDLAVPGWASLLVADPVSRRRATDVDRRDRRVRGPHLHRSEEAAPVPGRGADRLRRAFRRAPDRPGARFLPALARFAPAPHAASKSAEVPHC